MTRDDHNPKLPSPERAARSGLRLVKAEPEAPVAPTPARAPRPKSRLVQLMTAYADAIDNDVRAILDL